MDARAIRETKKMNAGARLKRVPCLWQKFVLVEWVCGHTLQTCASGEDWNQKKISLLEQKEAIETSLLKQISEVLNIPVEAFQNFDEEQAVNIISNTFDNGSILNGINHNVRP